MSVGRIKISGLRDHIERGNHSGMETTEIGQSGICNLSTTEIEMRLENELIFKGRKY